MEIIVKILMKTWMETYKSMWWKVFGNMMEIVMEIDMEMFWLIVAQDFIYVEQWVKWDWNLRKSKKASSFYR